MKRLPTITSVKTNVFYQEQELKRIVDCRSHILLRRKTMASQLPAIHEYVPVSTCSVNICLQGTLQISFTSGERNHINYLVIPAATRFLVTCISVKGSMFIPAIQASLS